MSLDDPDSTDEDEGPFDRGHVVWVGRETVELARPFLILSANEQLQDLRAYIGVPLSSDEQEQAIPIQPENWERGGLDEVSFALPWRIQTVQHNAIEQGIGALSDELVDEIAAAVQSYLHAAS